MSIPAMIMVLSLFAVSGSWSLAVAENPSFTCSSSEGGKRLTVRGSNNSGQSIKCSAVTCEAFIAAAGATRKCEIKTSITLPPNTQEQDVGSCYDDAHPATRVVGVSFSC